MMRQLFSLLLIVLLGIMTSACAKPGKVYPLTLDDTRSLLTSSGELDIVVTPGKVLKLNSAESTDNLLIWDIHNSGQPVMRFKAHLSPENALSTRVAVSLEAGPSSKQKEIQQRMEKDPTVNKLYLAAMDEAISARIERRGFNYLAIHQQTAAATAANIDQIHAEMRKSMEAAAKEDESRSHSVYGSQSQTNYYTSRGTSYDQYESAYHRKQRLDQQTAPSVDLSDYNRRY